MADYIKAVRERTAGRDLALMFEPGRFIVANAGVLLTRVEYLKHTEHKDFAIVDAAMNDLIRPSLYQAWMNVTAVRPRDAQQRTYDVVGPICETGDSLFRSARPVTSWPRTVNWRWKKAICWPCIRRAPMALS